MDCGRIIKNNNIAPVSSLIVRVGYNFITSNYEHDDNGCDVVKHMPW